MLTLPRRKAPLSTDLDPKLFSLLLTLCLCADARQPDCPSSKWNAMCRPCCEYHLIQCCCPSRGSGVGYTVPCCRNALDQCDPCIIHPGCSLFENCKSCNNGTWKANDDFFVDGKYCTECRPGWSGGDCRISSVDHPPCAPPEEPANGYLLPVHGPKEELVSVNYRCHPPFKPIGSQQRICLPNGTWSGAVPTCVKGQTRRARCSPPPKLLNGYHRAAPDAFGGAEVVGYFCKNSYILSGNPQSTCLANGSWSSGPPKCVRACREPKVSELVRQSVVKPRLTSRVNPDERLRLSSGYTAAFPRGLHPVLTSLEYTCASPLYRHTGSSRRTCLKSGRWSGRHVSCSPVCGKFDPPGPHNLTDTPWPWHVAVYVRSPPDGPRGAPEPVQRGGASEESTFWRLACSGALLGRRGVLVAARCVVDEDEQRTLHPAHVKVVMGARRRTSEDRRRSPRRLEVSSVSVHPDSSSPPHSGVAVLRLRVKAGMDERVRPVCLPAAPGGEETPREAYAARWTLPDRRRGPAGRTALAQLVDVARCERRLARGGTLGDDALCLFEKTPGPRGSCPGGVPGIATASSPAGWQLLGLETFNYKEEEEEEEEVDCLQRYTVHTRIDGFRDWIVKNTK
ncbi:inactive serine protease PAMR1 isoform X1 [Pseudoliparis swirei]|uniref:inactive serine protease PAMR1 isoform X1 n=1 Tax=Pseudoliparis swirei TaxID=2059687 RepID=UPI0024BD84B9|nr:inactive serine protease PAMR1 isoform X1 [Pseudoliparis swirei]